jgi:nucleoside-diphosphate kinase
MLLTENRNDVRKTPRMTETPNQQTLVLIKPDALKLSLTGYVLSQLSEFHTGLRFAAAKIVHVSRMLAEEHYAEHKGKFFYPPLIDYLAGRSHYADTPQKRRVIALVYHGPNAVQKIRDIAGPTSPHVARERSPGTIRALGTIVPVLDAEGNRVGERMDNLIHASATPAEAEREIKLWFEPCDVMPYMRGYSVDVCNEHYYYSRLEDQSRVWTTQTAESVSIVSPGEIMWTSDLDALRAIVAGRPAACSLDAVAAKYLMNREPEGD